MPDLLIVIFCGWALALVLICLRLRAVPRPQLKILYGIPRGRYRYVKPLGRKNYLFRRAVVLPSAVPAKPVAPVTPAQEPAPLPMQKPEPVPPSATVRPEPVAPFAAQPTAEAQPVHSADTAPRPARPARRPARHRNGFVLFLAVDAVLIICLVIAVVRATRLHESAVSVDEDTQQEQQMQEEERRAEKEAATATPTPVPTPSDYSNPLHPASNLGDTGEYVAGTWLNLELQDADNSYSPSITLSINDEGTGEQVYYQDRTPVTQDSRVSYCFETPGRYIVTAYVTAGDNTESEYLVMNIKIYAAT